MPGRGLRCSFCGRNDSQVDKLVAGPQRVFAGRVYICDRCAVQTIEIMEGTSGDHPQNPTATSLLKRTWTRLLGRSGRRSTGSEYASVLN